MNPYEDRVTWDELAPSLQALFKQINQQLTSISNITNKLSPIVDNLVKLGDSTVTNNIMTIAGNTNTLANIINNSSAINELIQKKDEIINVTNVFGGTSMDWSGDPGKIAKTNNYGQLICDDLVYTIRAAGNATDVQTLSTIPLSMDDIFYQWDRISCNAKKYPNITKNDQNLFTTEHLKSRAAYRYNSTKKTIFETRNSDSWSCFLSNSLYDPNFQIRYALDTTQMPSNDGTFEDYYLNDDDGLFFVCGYMVDSNGVFHTLQVVRTGDSEASANNVTSHGQRFALVYDQYTAWSIGGDNLLAYVPFDQIERTGFNNNYTLIQVEKSYDSTTGVAQIKATTGNTVTAANKASAALDKSFTWTMPTSKPSNWSQAMYDNIKTMMTGPSKIGFGTQSNCCGFNVDTTNTKNIMDVIEIFDLSTGTIKYFDSKTNTWVTSKQKAIGNTIQPNSLVYSQFIKKLFYFRRDNNFVEIKLS